MTELADLFESLEPELVISGFIFTEGPLWHPSGILYVSDVDAEIHYRVRRPGNRSEEPTPEAPPQAYPV